MEMQDQEEEALDEVIESEPEGETHHAAMQSDSGLEEEPEHPPVGYPTGGLVEDRWWSPEPHWPQSEEDEEEAQHLARMREPRSQGGELFHSRVTGRLEEKTNAPNKSWEGQSPKLKGTKQRRLRMRMERTKNQEWEAARQDAWLRQLSDTLSGEDEESCGRSAESGRWISELFKISQYPAMTSGGECSGRETPDYS